MGLYHGDAAPDHLRSRESYAKIREWLTTHIIEIAQRDGEFASEATRLIRALPSPSSITDAEMYSVFEEIIMGLLEWLYHSSDGDYKMAAYAHAGIADLKSSGFDASELRSRLSRSRLWPYLSVCRR